MRPINSRCDLLNLEWASSGRDIDIVEPVLSYLEYKHDLNIVRVGIANFGIKILKYRPKAIIISNGGGAPENFQVVKFASQLGVKVITLISEGDYASDCKGVEEFFWGWNKEHIFYEDLHLEWTERNLKLIHQHITESEDFNIKVSGATGFDRYKLLSHNDTEMFLSRYNKKKYKKIIGIAAWGFDQVFGEYFKKFEKEMEIRLEKKSVKIHSESKELLRNIIKQLIENNTDILFILKHHPGMLEEEYTEFYELGHYDNTLIIKGTSENIEDVINVSDIWMAYESTTCLEAWMLGKQTMLINPISSEFKRSKIADGSPIKKTYQETQDAIVTFYSSAKIPGFAELEEKRKDIVQQVVQWDDGKNHIRAGEYIYEMLIEPNTKSLKITLWMIRVIAKNMIKGIIYYSLLRKIKYFANKVRDIEHFNRIFDTMQREQQHQNYKKNLEGFYDRHDS